MAERKKKSSKTALQKVGSFLGVTEDDSQMNVWKEKCTERAQTGEIGVSFRNIIPGSDRGQKQLLNQLQHTLSEVSAACEENQLLLDEFAQSAIPHTDMRKEQDSSTIERPTSQAASSRRGLVMAKVPIGKRKAQHLMSPVSINEDQAGPSGQNTLRPPSAQNVRPKSGHASEMIEMMPTKSLKPNRSGQSEKIDVEKKPYTPKTGTHPAVSKILSDMVRENENRRQAASYRLYYKKPPKLRESLLSAVEREGGTEEVSSGSSEVAITSREHTQSEPCLQQNKNKDRSNLAVAMLKRHSDWTGNPEVFAGDVKAIRRSSITFSPLVKKFTFPMEPSFESGRSENLLKKLFRTKQPRLQQLQKEGMGQLVGEQQREVAEAIIQPEVSHEVYTVASSNLTHLEQRPSKSILKTHMFEGSGEFELNSELDEYDDSESKLHLVPTEANDEYLYRAEALEHYRKFVADEMAFKKEGLLRKKLALEKMIIQKQKLIDDVLEMTDAHFYDPRGNPKKGWKQLMKENCRVLFLNESKDGRNRSIREQLYRLHEFMPIFTYFMCVTQFIVTVILVTLGGVSPVGLEPLLVLRSNVPTFRGLETVEHWNIRNIWVGPPPMFFIRMGGLFAPCLRDDVFVNMLYSMKGYGEEPVIGCCEMPNRHAAATTTEKECNEMTTGVGIWWKAELCSERRKQNVSWMFNHILRPCCYSLKTQCKMMSHEHCTFLGGYFFLEDNPKTEHCSLVNCVSNLCSLTGRSSKPKMPYLTTGIGQWYRLITSVFEHQGIIHVLLVMLLQLLIGHQIEVIAGWLRIGIIYWVSAIMGLLVGATFNPYLPHLGAGAAVFGLIGVTSVELIQSWQLVAHPWREVLKLFLICGLFILSGTLPFVDNMELMAGYMFGALTGIIVLPYITFGKWHAMRKRTIVAFAVPVLLLSIFAVFFLFLHVQWIASLCTACSKINCVPYTKTMCKINELW